MFLRQIQVRAFCSSIPLPQKFPAKQVTINVGALAVAMGAGSLLYDYLSGRNLEKITESIGQDLSWDDEWDRYVRVPKEVHEDIKRWFISPDVDMVKEREDFDEANDIGARDILMVRHGQYITEEARFGHLTDLGKEQAALTGARLKELLQGRKVRCIFHSSMERAKETAEQISKHFPGVPLKETPILSEAIPAIPDPPSANCPEFVEEEAMRLEKAFRTFFARPIGEGSNESVDIIVGHGNCFRFFVCRAMQIDPRYWLRMSIYNCGISWVDLDASGRVSVRGVGDIGHLPRSKLTYS